MKKKEDNKRKKVKRDNLDNNEREQLRKQIRKKKKVRKLCLITLMINKNSN